MRRRIEMTAGDIFNYWIQRTSASVPTSFALYATDMDAVSNIVLRYKQVGTALVCRSETQNIRQQGTYWASNQNKQPALKHFG
jgi:hypothetical protein